MSDCEVGAGEIVFKDPSVQRAWSPPAACAPGAKAGAAGGERKSQQNGKGGKGRKGSKGGAAGGGAVSESMRVPEWGDSSNSGDEMWAKDTAAAPRLGDTGAAKKRKMKSGLSAAEEKAAALKAEQAARRAELLAEHEARQAGRAAYFKKRKAERARHLQKTPSGQPRLKNMIGGILGKLQAES
jgi:hypothetical protein